MYNISKRDEKKVLNENKKITKQEKQYMYFTFMENNTPVFETRLRFSMFN